MSLSLGVTPHVQQTPARRALGAGPRGPGVGVPCGASAHACCLATLLRVEKLWRRHLVCAHPGGPAGVADWSPPSHHLALVLRPRQPLGCGGSWCPRSGKVGSLVGSSRPLVANKMLVFFYFYEKINGFAREAVGPA